MKQHYINLVKYEKWALQKVINSISEAKIVNSNEKINLLVSHILQAQEIWLQRLEGKKVRKRVWENLVVSEMGDTLERNLNGFILYIESLSENQLIDNLFYVNLKGDPYSNKISDILGHLSFHSAYHRGQIIELLKETGVTLPVTDFIVYCRENDK